MTDKIPPQQPFGMVNLPTPPPRKASDYLNSYDSWVYGAVNAIAQEVANLKLHLYKVKYTKKGAEVDEQFEHESLSLLRNVNDYMTSYQLIELTQIFLELMGEAYWLLLRGAGGKPDQIWILRPDWVYVKKSDKTFIESYVYSPSGYGAGQGVVIPAGDIVPFKYPNPTNPYRGRGAVQASSMAIDTDRFSAEWNRNFFFNSALPYIILRTKKKPKPEEITRFVAQWESKLQGRNNAHKIALLTGDWEAPTELGSKMKEMDFIEQRRMMRDEILATFKVGKSTLNITEDVNRANAEATNLNFMERTIKPKLTRLVAHLNEFYLAPNWEGEDLFFDYEDPSPQDVERDLKIVESAKNSWMTTNEIREMHNLPPVKGGDSIYMPFTLTPIEDIASNAVEGVKNFFGFKSGKERESGVIKLDAKGGKKPRKLMMPIPPKALKRIRAEKDAKDIEINLFKLVNNLISEQSEEQLQEKRNKGKVKGQRLPWSKEKRDAHWEKMVAKTDVLEGKMKGKVKDLFVEQERQVIQNLSSLKHYADSRKKDSASDFLFNIASENKKWKKVLAPVIRNVVADKGREILEFLGIDATLDLSVATASAYLKIEGLAFIKGVNNHTVDRLKKVLSEGLERDEGIPDLKRRVEDVFDVAKGSRSEMIARTEVIRSTNFATEEAFKQSEVVEAKEWLTAKDERVDDECADLDGDIAELGDEFKGVGFPPLHPNCRCTILPVLQ